MDTPFASGLKLEMLYGIGDIEFRAVHRSRFERPIQQLSRRTDERSSLSIFFVAGLLTHQNHTGLTLPFPKYCLSRILIEIAPLATLRRFTKPI
jgi:hypothetical protein